MFYNNLKNLIKKLPILWNFLKKSKDAAINLSRFIDVLMMHILLHLWPEHAYRFSTRKLLPSKKNKFSKETKPFIPYQLLNNKCSDIPTMKEINIVARGPSFDINKLKNIDTPTFLISFYNSLKVNKEGKVYYVPHNFYKNSFAHKMSDHPINNSDESEKEYKNKNITYVVNKIPLMKMLKKNGHKVLSVDVHIMDEEENYLTTLKDPLYDELIDNVQCKRISVAEKVYRPPILKPHLNWAPAGSLLQALSALSYYSEKINVYGWDNHLNFSPENKSYWNLLFNLYNYQYDINDWKAQFEHSLINIYYGYQFSKLPNINIYGHMGKLSKHKKLVKKIEKVLFN